MAMPIEWGGSDMFTHMLVVGATRSGKTATILKPMIYQLLLAKKRGVELGLTVVEPKGDLAQMVADMSEAMDLPHLHIDPMIGDKSAKFNPMEGETDRVAEATVIVLKGLFGKQDAFFATVQELSARYITKLLKELNGDQMDIIDVLKTLRDPDVLKMRVAELRQRDGESDIVNFFETELLGTMADRYRQFVIGLRAQLENIVSNSDLRNIMIGKSDIDMNTHFDNGGILSVNTALGLLRSSGDAFGQFIIMHLQDGTLRRKGTEETRIPHFLIVDEYSRYINPEVETFLSLAAEYRVAGILATQSLGQLAIESGKLSGQEMKRTIMASCRNRIVFGGVTMDDAKDFAEEFGKDKVIVRQSTYENKIVGLNLFPKMFRDTETEEFRFDPTDIRNGLARFVYIHQLMKDGVLQEPAIGQGTFVPRNWRELREWEDKSNLPLIQRLNPFARKKESDHHLTDLKKKEIAKLEDEAEQEDELLERAEKTKELETKEHVESFNDVVDLSQLEKEKQQEVTTKTTEHDLFTVSEREKKIEQISTASQSKSKEGQSKITNEQTNESGRHKEQQVKTKPSQKKEVKEEVNNKVATFTSEKKNDDMFF